MTKARLFLAAIGLVLVLMFGGEARQVVRKIVSSWSTHLPVQVALSPRQADGPKWR